MQLARGDAYLRAKTKEESVRKARRTVMKHIGTIHTLEERTGVRVAGSDDGVGMMGTIAVNVVNRCLKIVHNAHGQDGVEVFGAPVLLCGGLTVNDGARRFIRAQLDAFFAQGLRRPGEEGAGDALMYQQRFRGVAHRKVLRFAVHRQAHRHVQIARIVHVEVAKPFRVAFVYDRNPLSSGWISLHERGREKLQQRLGSTVATRSFTDRSSDGAFDQAVEEAVADGVDLVISCSPTQMRQTLRAAAEHPGPAYLNCSVSLSHSAVRGFYGRMYEAKFLLGALAASLAGHHKVGYVAESPVFSTVAEINAFAIGAAMVDPYVTVHLKWFSAKDYDWRREFREEGVHVISGRDYANPLAPKESWGLYQVDDDGMETHLAEPVWKWGRYYELLVRSIRNDTWKKEGERIQGQSLNYWWGMSAGVLDVRLSEDLPRGQRMLVDVLRQSVLSGRVHPFTGELRAQGGDVVQGPEAGRLTSEQIVRMRWLNENVVGRLPEQRELDRDGLVEVEVAGVIPVDPSTVLLKDTAR